MVGSIINAVEKTPLSTQLLEITDTDKDVEDADDGAGFISCVSCSNDLGGIGKSDDEG